MRRLLLALALPSLAAGGLAACGGPARVDLDPASLKLYGAGQAAGVHATPRDAKGRALLERPCSWSSSDPRVATVSGKHLDATVTSVAPGLATVTCEVGGAKAQLAVAVRRVARITAAPAEAALELADERRPLALRVEVLDEEGAIVPGRIAFTRCADEEVCRGDARGQLWAVGAGATTATVEVEGVTASVRVTVKDVRTEATRPQVLEKGYMEDLERAVRKREAAEAAAAARAAGAAAKP